MEYVKWLFFDLGYTLINEDEAHNKRILNAIEKMKEHGIFITSEDFIKGMINASQNYKSSPFFGFLEDLGFDYKIPYPKELETPYEDSISVLKELHKKYKIGIIANQSIGTLDRIEKYGFMPYIDLCYSSTEKGLSKPDLKFFKLALNEAGCVPTNAYMIGDRLDNDIFPAKKLGMKTIRILKGFGVYQQPINDYYCPDITINNLSELLSIFTTKV